MADASPAPSQPTRRSLLGRILRIGAIVVAVLLLLAGGAWLGRFEILRRMQDMPPFTHSAGVERSQSVAMRDGVSLATTIFLPDAEDGAEGSWPTVLIRNPYARFDVVARGWCAQLVRYGYGCVYQDVRGQGESEGEWTPLENEGVDGHDTLWWLAEQPFQDGNIGMIGPSYLAAVQWAAASEGLPPEVKTLVPAAFTTDSHAVLYQDGMFRHETFTAWASMMPKRGMPDEDAGPRYRKAIRHRPHSDVAEGLFGSEIPWYRNWIESPARAAPLWQRADFVRLTQTPQRLDLPVLMIGGWYDVFLGPQMKDWQRLASRSKSRFIVGPWTHVGQGGEAFETPDAPGGLLQWTVLLDWLGHHLRGEPLENGPGVATYVMRDNRWVTRPDWPPSTRNMRLYLQSTADSTRCNGGRLADTAPAAPERASYTYDPESPVPTRGGAGMLAFVLPDFGGAPPANVWQEGLCERPDVLSFTSEPVSTPLTVAGEVDVVLTVVSDAPDTSFTAKLVEVLPDGRAVNIRDAITSLAYRNGAPAPLPYTPGSPVEVRIRMWPIEWTVPAGSRLRLDVSSSDFPKFHAHPNRAGLWSAQTDTVPAHQTLLTGPGLQGWIDLPVAVDAQVSVVPSGR